MLEATGVYHQTAATALFDAGVRVSVVNPAQIKEFARGLAVRSKNDALDSAVLARYGALVNPDPWQPEPRAVRELKPPPSWAWRPSSINRAAASANDRACPRPAMPVYRSKRFVNDG